MKIAIYNLGPIHRYQFDTTKDFQVVVGKNSVGKSYAMTLVYIVLKALLGVPESLRTPSALAAALDDSALESKLKRLTPHKEYEPRDVRETMADFFRLIFDAVLSDRLREPIASSFAGVAALSNRFSREPLRVEIDAARCSVSLGLNDQRIYVDKVVCGNYRSKRMRAYRSPEDTSSGRMLYVNSDLSQTRSLVAGEAANLLRQLAEEVSAEIGSIHYLPAIRSGLYQALSGLGPIVAQLSKSRSLITREISLPYLTAPQNDYFLAMSSIDPADSQTAHPGLQRIADAIEDHIVGGKVELDVESNRLLFAPTNTLLRLDLGATSSMVSQLAPLIAYCRYVLGKARRRLAVGVAEDSSMRAMMIIEEPEAHLHPEAQVQLVEQLLALSRIGVKVVLTSHSDYIYNKLSNRVSAGGLAPESVAATLFTMGEHGSEGKPLAVDAYGIDDENFVDAAEALYMEKAAAFASDA